MIIFNFDRIFRARGIQRKFSFMRQAGYSEHFSSKVANNRLTRISAKDLERICVLLRCSPNDICEWIPNNDEHVDENHPLNEIRRTRPFMDIANKLNHVPFSQLEEIEEAIQQTIAEKLKEFKK